MIKDQTTDQKEKSCGSCIGQSPPSHKTKLSHLRRINEGRYCPDILVQTKAVSAAIRSLEAALFARHIKHCIQEAFTSDDEADREAKVTELIEIFGKRLDR